MSKISKGNLKINSALFDFINKEVLPDTSIESEKFWLGFDKAVHELQPINKKLIEKRDEIQKKIDVWHKENTEGLNNYSKYLDFLKSIDYISKEYGNFSIYTKRVDEEIATIAGTQLVVPVDNARYALNAANASWGSLYDALYGTDVIEGTRGKNYDPVRGQKVRDYVRKFFDKAIPINNESWVNIQSQICLFKDI